MIWRWRTLSAGRSTAVATMPSAARERSIARAAMPKDGEWSMASFDLREGADLSPLFGDRPNVNAVRQDERSAAARIRSKSSEECRAAGAARPLVTVAIPTFNRADLVEQCVRSVMEQTYPNIEILVSDNASSDETLKRLSAIDDKRLRVVTSQTNVGAIGNFNKCIDEARGDYFVLAADDNFYRPQFVEKCVRLIEIEPNLPIVLAAYDVLIVNEFFDNDRRVVPARLSKKLSTGVWQGTDILQEYLHGRISAQLLSSLVRTDILRRNGGYNPHPCASDEATWIPFLLEGRAGLVNEPCATYMVLRESVTEGFTADQRLSDLCAVMDELSDVAEEKIPDPALRARIQRLLTRYVAYMAAVNLVIYRRGGGRLPDAVRTLWSWRGLLGRCSLADFLTTWRLRSVSRIIFPSPVARWATKIGLDKIG